MEVRAILWLTALSRRLSSCLHFDAQSLLQPLVHRDHGIARGECAGSPSGCGQRVWMPMITPVRSSITGAPAAMPLASMSCMNPSKLGYRKPSALRS